METGYQNWFYKKWSNLKFNSEQILFNNNIDNSDHSLTCRLLAASKKKSPS